jgi:hypothetical protein
MKFLIALFFSFMSTAAVAADPPYACDPGKGCREVPGPAYDIGRGAILTLPFGWRVFSYPQAPVPEMAGLHEFLAFKNGVVIAISPFPNLDKRVINEDYLCDSLKRGSSLTYVKQSKEQAITTVPMSHGDVVGCHVSFNAANAGEKPFLVLPRMRHASVASFKLSYKDILLSISAASEKMPDEDFALAGKSIQQIH